nr:MAG TPA: hypothetical protein [Caudoviricetes sp.]DAW38689.1 MAG TPA: hypothetical protein [Caudoviricetes sp.]
MFFLFQQFSLLILIYPNYHLHLVPYMKQV